ncbi:phage baseplate assembly protein V [Nitrosomonas sp.]|uniref:phage baseplate assembly protein V n=1 Tax=Nitrosomonas sp. TaxID=42353 RepID=UPI0025CB87BE|nr:phage baseplate assembly protein V [Nitrosomonas sp.]
MSENTKKFYGKYRGTVVQNIDPEFRGRIMCLVPAVLGVTPSGWCEACTPLAGPTGTPMGVYMVPPIGAGVWVEFEQGDPGKPIWSGCRFASGDAPTLALTSTPPLAPNIAIQSQQQHMIMVSDMPPTPMTGGIMLRSFTGAMIVVNDSGIYISNGKGAMITMIGTVIDFNTGALTILK